MYHRACVGRHGNAPEMLDAHFAHVAHHHPQVLPGEALAHGATNVCLSFDDAYFDFYATVFPLLQRHNLRALLAVPPAFIGETASSSTADRLRIESEEAFARPERGGFCTWGELAEMVASGHVAVASHGLTHRRLDSAEVDMGAEIDQAQTVLRTRLGCPVESFVFPFGRYSARSLGHARRKHRHVFRIGGALNRSWSGRVLYRVDADRMATPQSLFAPARILHYRVRFLWNRLRLR